MPWDTTGFAAVQALTGHPVLDTAMTVAAEALVIAVPAVLVALWLSGPDSRRDSLYSFLVAIAGIVAAYGIGLLYSHPAPYQVAAYETIASGAPENAFPSQHTAALLATAAGLHWRNHGRTGHILLGLGVLTGFARVYIGEHYPVDLLGAAVAAGIGLGLVATTTQWTAPIVERVAQLGDGVMERMRTGRG